MRLGNEDLYEPRDYSIRRPRRSSRKLLKIAFGFGLAGLSALAGGQMLLGATDPAVTVTRATPDRIEAPATARAVLPPAIPHVRQASLIDPGYLDGAAALAFGRNVALRAEHAARRVLLANLNPQVQVSDPVSEEEAEDREITAAETAKVAGAPLPTPRPSDLAGLSASPASVAFPAPPPRPAGLAALVAPEKPAPESRAAAAPTKGRVVTASAPAQPAGPDGGTFLEKLFGGQKDAAGPQLAYAAPQEGAVRDYSSGVLPGAGASYDKFTAIYDISSKIVHLPNGAKLEAHSGLGQFMDDPRNVHLRMRGATPPALYDLKEREALFHGVRAIRLTPINSAVHGRSGLLAHTYMLGPSGQSNGCVSFRNYDAFLQAFLRGEVKRLAVVAKL